MGISAKKQKTIKKTVHNYCLAFGFRPPYQVIVDGEFCRAALEKQIYVKDALPDLLGGLTRTVVTDCILKDIKSKGHDFTSAYVLAQKFDRRKCPHTKDKTQVSAQQCIRDLVSTNNPEHFFVASGDVQLKNAIRKIPGVPVVIVNTRKKGLGLEDMTARTKSAMHHNEIEKVKPLDKETARLKRALLGEEEKTEQTPKKRKVKGVNPLAMKKKKKVNPPPAPKKNKQSL
ncbi:Fcf1-domain-containing protein [Sporodiniella umbellata]|nr:Fcf1-domain-containing protein [Sporodiniella umbellata]